jgi:hypothetical protein
MSRANYAAMVKCAPRAFHDLMFVNYDRDCYAKEYTIDWSAAKWERYIDELEKLQHRFGE